MPVVLGYSNAKAVAHAVRDEMKERGIEPLMAFPYSPYNPDASTWWVSPSTENPAYTHGKYAFTPALCDESELFCGMHIEKGFGRPVASLMTTSKLKRQLMENDWIWHDFIGDLAGGKLNAPVREIVKALGEPARLLVEAYYWAGDAKFDPYHKDDSWDEIEFSADGANIKLDASASRTPSGLLKTATSARNLGELGKHLSRVPKHEWVWINFWIGHDFTTVVERRRTVKWVAKQIYEKLLRPLRPWFT